MISEIGSPLSHCIFMQYGYCHGKVCQAASNRKESAFDQERPLPRYGAKVSNLA